MSQESYSIQLIPQFFKISSYRIHIHIGGKKPQTVVIIFTKAARTLLMFPRAPGVHFNASELTSAVCLQLLPEKRGCLPRLQDRQSRGRLMQA